MYVCSGFGASRPIPGSDVGGADGETFEDNTRVELALVLPGIYDQITLTEVA